MLEIYFALAPITFQQRSLKCTQNQLSAASNFESEMELWSVDKTRQEKVFLSSDMLSPDSSVKWQELDSEYLYTNLKLNVHESGHALSLFTSYQFANMHTTLTLKDGEGKVLQIDKTGLLDEVPESVDVYKQMPSTKSNHPLVMKPELNRRDLISYIQVNEIPVGEYTLEIGVPIGYFVKSGKFSTCLDFDLVVEYISRRKMSSDYNSDEEIPIQIVAVTPLGAKDLLQID
jgi:hypothetical protein